MLSPTFTHDIASALRAKRLARASAHATRRRLTYLLYAIAGAAIMLALAACLLIVIPGNAIAITYDAFQRMQ